MRNFERTTPATSIQHTSSDQKNGKMDDIFSPKLEKVLRGEVKVLYLPHQNIEDDQAQSVSMAMMNENNNVKEVELQQKQHWR